MRFSLDKWSRLDGVKNFKTLDRYSESKSEKVLRQRKDILYYILAAIGSQWSVVFCVVIAHFFFFLIFDSSLAGNCVHLTGVRLQQPQEQCLLYCPSG